MPVQLSSFCKQRDWISGHLRDFFKGTQLTHNGAGCESKTSTSQVLWTDWNILKAFMQLSIFNTTPPTFVYMSEVQLTPLPDPECGGCEWLLTQSPCLTHSVPGVTSRDGLWNKADHEGLETFDLGPLKPVSASRKADSAAGAGALTRWAWDCCCGHLAELKMEIWKTEVRAEEQREAKRQCQLWIQWALKLASFSFGLSNFLNK